MPLPSITAARTPAMGLPFLFPGQAQKEAFVNEAFARLDALVQPVVRGERSAPPADPVAGDSYLIADGASGAWSGQGRAIAVWAENQWLFLAPREGLAVYDLSNKCHARFAADAGWQRTAAPPLPMGGAVVDAEARAAIGQIVTALREAGSFL